MSKYEYDKETQVLGFDLGHGKFSVSKLTVGSHKNVDSPEPEIIEIIQGEKSQPTLVGYDKNGNILIGAATLNDNDAIDLDISFKAQPPLNEKQKKSLQDLCKGVHQNLKKGSKLEEARKYYTFVGCPSGWKDRVIEEYEKIIAESGLPNVVVQKESRAAFAYYRKKGEFSKAALEKGILLIDVGSSTTDYTFVAGPLDKYIDVSGKDLDATYALGAGLLDCEIFDLTLNKHECKEQLVDIFEKSPFHKVKCLLACRSAKEKYFNKITNFKEEPDKRVYSEFLPLPVKTPEGKYDEIKFEPLVTHRYMNEILHKPLPSLENASWLGIYEKQLRIIKEKCEIDKSPIMRVLITGGASRMPFVTEICQSVFQNEKVVITMGNEPELAVSRGLAILGRKILHTEHFRDKVIEIIDGKLSEIISSEIQKFYMALADSLSDKAVESVRPIFKKWNDNKISNADVLNEELTNGICKWLKFSKAKVLMENSENFTTRIGDELSLSLDGLSTEYILPSGIWKTKFESKSEVEIDPEAKIIPPVFDAGLGFFSGGVMGGLTAAGGFIGGLATSTPVVIAGLALPGIGLVIGSGFLVAGIVGVLFGFSRQIDDAQLSKILAEMKRDLQKKIQDEFDKDKLSRSRQELEMKSHIKKIMENIVDKARLMID